MIERDNTSFKLVDDLNIVCREKYGRPVPIDFFEESDDIPTMLRVEVAGRLISDQYPRLSYNSSRNRNALSMNSNPISARAISLRSIRGSPVRAFSMYCFGCR